MDLSKCDEHKKVVQQITALEKRAKKGEEFQKDTNSKMTDFAINLAENNVSTAQLNNTMVKLDKTLDTMTGTIVEQGKIAVKQNVVIENINSTLKGIEEKLGKQDEEIKDINEKIDANENKNKIDLRDINNRRAKKTLLERAIPWALVVTLIGFMVTIIVALINRGG